MALPASFYHDADMAALRNVLASRLDDLNTWRKLELELLYPGIDPDCLYSDPHRNLVDVLHFEMRVSERIIWELFSFPLKKNLPDAHSRLQAAVAATAAPPL